MKRITITTELYAEVPDTTEGLDIACITLEIPYENIRIDTFNGPIAGARVYAYCTKDVEVDG